VAPLFKPGLSSRSVPLANSRNHRSENAEMDAPAQGPLHGDGRKWLPLAGARLRGLLDQYWLVMAVIVASWLF
jgi:hypothetical protein